MQAKTAGITRGMSDESTTEQIPAAQWRHLRFALSDRMRSLAEARDAAKSDKERENLQKQIDELREQIQALAVEEAVAQFVEDAERYVIVSNTLSEELRRDPDEEIA